MGSKVLPVPATTTTSVPVGQPVAGSVDRIGQDALYTFDAVAWSTITAHATGACVDGLLWELLRPDGQSLAETATCRDLSSVASQGGTYTIHVHGNQTATGAYAFTLQGNGSEDEPTTGRVQAPEPAFWVRIRLLDPGRAA